MFKGHRIIVIGDAHDSPHIKQDRFKWIGKYIKSVKPDYIIHLAAISFVACSLSG